MIPWPFDLMLVALLRSGLLAILMFVIVAKIGSVAAGTLLSRLLPAVPRQSALLIVRGPIKMFFVGLVATVPVYALLAALSGYLGWGYRLFALVALGLAAVPLLAGIGGVYLLAGRKAQRSAGGSAETEDEVFHGGALVEVATLLPLIGQMASVLLLLVAFGSGIILLLEAAGARDAIGDPPDPA